MSDGRMRLLLFLAIFVVSALPLAAAAYFVDDALQTSLNLGFNPQIVRSLEIGTQNLKTLKNVDPGNERRYREQFEEIQSLKRVYSRPQWIKSNILGSLKIYFGLGLTTAVLVSVMVAAFLSRKISRSYRHTLNELVSQKQRMRYLEEMASWQELARMLAHEIKNPLTPIEVLVSSLSRSYLSKSALEFGEQLTQTQVMIAEELNHLKSTVSRFSEFATLPAVRLAEEDLSALIARLAPAITANFDTARIEVIAPASEVLRARVDATLFRQVMTNIIRNGVEANPGQTVRFAIRVAAVDSTTIVTISNDGQPVQADIAGRIFDPYVSGKSRKDNMGLGLAIVRKIIIEHGGDVTYAEACGQPVFTISLPRAT